MNNVKSNPIGVDKAIQRMQDYLYASLNWNKLEAHGRIYKNEGDNGMLPQPFLDNGSYVHDVFIVDKNNAHIFFIVDEKQELVSGSIFKTEVKTVFMVNLKNLFPDITHRADAEAQAHAFNLISKKKAFQIKSIETGLKNALKGFDTSEISEVDIQPYHVFTIVSEVQYKINPNC